MSYKYTEKIETPIKTKNIIRVKYDFSNLSDKYDMICLYLSHPYQTIKMILPIKKAC